MLRSNAKQVATKEAEDSILIICQGLKMYPEAV
jgi:hypothetical protein